VEKTRTFLSAFADKIPAILGDTLLAFYAIVAIAGVVALVYALAA
jgi:hypothetical protein